MPTIRATSNNTRTIRKSVNHTEPPDRVFWGFGFGSGPGAGASIGLAGTGAFGFGLVGCLGSLLADGCHGTSDIIVRGRDADLTGCGGIGLNGALGDCGVGLGAGFGSGLSGGAFGFDLMGRVRSV